MNKTELIIGIIAILNLVGIVVLSILGKEFSILPEVLIALVGYLIGRKQDQLMGAFKK